MSNSDAAPGKANQHDQPPEVSRAEFLKIYTAVVLPMFMGAVDQTLLAAATPVIAVEFGDLYNTPWIATAYLLTHATMGPVYGRLGDRYGRREVMLASLAIFVFGAIVCSLAPSMNWLIAGRAMQGLGGGGLMSLSMALIGDMVPPRQRARFQGYFAALFTGAHVCGPMIGGLVVANVSWRWLFVGYIPLVALALWRIALLPRGSVHVDAPGVRDLTGLALFALGITSLLFGLSSAGLRFPWLSWQTAAFPCFTAVVWVLLFLHESRHPAPFFPIELLRIVALRRVCLPVISTTFCLLSLVFYLPIYLQLGMHTGVGESGVLLAPVMLGMVIGGIVTGQIVSRTGEPQPLPKFGLSLSAIALLALALVPANVVVIVTLGFLAGLGFGPTMPTTQLIAQTVAGRERLGSATSMISLARTLGAAMGTALTGAVIYSLLPDIDVKQLGQSGSGPASPEILHAFHTAFFITALVAAFGAFSASRVPRVRV